MIVFWEFSSNFSSKFLGNFFMFSLRFRYNFHYGFATVSLRFRYIFATVSLHFCYNFATVSLQFSLRFRYGFATIFTTVSLPFHYGFAIITSFVTFFIIFYRFFSCSSFVQPLILLHFISIYLSLCFDSGFLYSAYFFCHSNIYSRFFYLLFLSLSIIVIC